MRERERVAGEGKTQRPITADLADLENPPCQSPTQPRHHADQRDEEDDDYLRCVSIGLMRV